MTVTCLLDSIRVVVYTYTETQYSTSVLNLSELRVNVWISIGVDVGNLDSSSCKYVL